VSSRDNGDVSPPSTATRAVGLLAPALLLLFLLLASLFWRTQNTDQGGKRRISRDPCRPLVRAVEQGDLAQVQTLLKQGCSANYQRPGVLSGPTDQRARRWLQSRSDRSRFAGTPVLEIAAQNNDPSVLTLLLTKGAKLNARGVYGYTALMRAAGRGNVEAVSLLLKAGADPNVRDALFGETALHKAARSSNRRFGEPAGAIERRKKVARLLLQAGADKNITNSRGRKALDGFPLEQGS
jgi:ankyrin repeat protein